MWKREANIHLSGLFWHDYADNFFEIQVESRHPAFAFERVAIFLPALCHVRVDVDSMPGQKQKTGKRGGRPVVRPDSVVFTDFRIPLAASRGSRLEPVQPSDY